MTAVRLAILLAMPVAMFAMLAMLLLKLLLMLLALAAGSPPGDHGGRRACAHAGLVRLRSVRAAGGLAGRGEQQIARRNGAAGDDCPCLRERFTKAQRPPAGDPLGR